MTYSIVLLAFFAVPAQSGEPIYMAQNTVCYWAGGAYSVGSKLCVNNNQETIICQNDGTWLSLKNYITPDGYQCK